MRSLSKLLLLGTCLMLVSCASGQQTTGRIIDVIPSWLGGEPEGVPPRPGTPEYDAWMAKRAQDAARQKTNQTK